MKRSWLAVTGATLLAGCATSAPPAAPAPAAAADFPTTAPELGPAPPLRVPEPVRRTLPNGLTVLYVRQPELPLVHATLVGRGGEADAPAAAPELATFTAEMLDEGAGGRSALELAAEVERLGASLETDAGWDAAQVDLEVLRPRLPEALRLMADVVARPDFPAAEVERIREQRLTDLNSARDEPRIIAANAFARLVYGAEHPYGRLAAPASTRAIDRAELERFHQTYYRPASSVLILVGDVSADSLHSVVAQAFGAWSAGAAPATSALATPGLRPTTIFLVDKPGAAQSEIRIGHPGVARNNPDYFPLVVLNTLLGGSFTSRLNMNLREAHGYAYGARSSFDMRRGAGPFTASSAVVTAKTDSATLEFFRELRRIRDEAVPQDELERAKRYVALGMPRNWETTGSVASQLAGAAVYDLPADFYENYVPRVMAVTAEDVRRVANRYLHPDSSAVVVVGDRKTIEPGLRALGLGGVEVRPASDFVP